MRSIDDADDAEKKQKRPWKRYRRDGKLKAEQRKKAERAYRMTREVAKSLHIPFIP